MKKIIIIFLLSFLIQNAKSQGMNFDRFHLAMNNRTDVNLVLFNPKVVVDAMLGTTPPPPTKLEGDALTQDIDVYTYFNNSIYINVDDPAKAYLWGFELKTNDFYLYYNTKKIIVGDDIKAVIKDQFPISYEFRKQVTVDFSSQMVGMMVISLEDSQDKLIGHSLYIFYDSNDKIIEISMYDDH